MRGGSEGSRLYNNWLSLELIYFHENQSHRERAETHYQAREHHQAIHEGSSSITQTLPTRPQLPTLPQWDHISTWVLVGTNSIHFQTTAGRICKWHRRSCVWRFEKVWNITWESGRMNRWVNIVGLLGSTWGLRSYIQWNTPWRPSLASFNQSGFSAKQGKVGSNWSWVLGQESGRRRKEPAELKMCAKKWVQWQAM